MFTVAYKHTIQKTECPQQICQINIMFVDTNNLILTFYCFVGLKYFLKVYLKLMKIH